MSQRHPGVPSQLPNIFSSGTNPRTGHWTACLCPVKDVTVEPHRRTEKGGKGEFSFLPTCGQEKQSAAALPSLTPAALPGFLCLGCFRPLATTGAIPRTGFQVIPLYSQLYRQRGPT